MDPSTSPPAPEFPTLPTPLLHRPLDLTLVLFFVLHLIVSLLVDLQFFLPGLPFPAWQRALVQHQIQTNHDFLVATLPPWFFSFVVCEFVIQVPFYAVGAYAFWAGKEWIRVPALLYGAHTATTMIAILTEIAVAGHLSLPQRLNLTAIYAPFAVMPLVVIYRVLQSPVFQPCVDVLKKVA